jgi:CheY-like chemotaxis protein
MGGQVAVASTPGTGTTFSFNITALRGKESIDTDITSNVTAIEGKTILIVDDNITNLNILSGQLEQWNLKPMLARTPQNALDLLSTGKQFDLAIIDMQMPDMDGVQLTERIKANHPELPIVLLSAAGSDASRNHQNLFSSVTTKPVKQSTLFRHILGALGKQERTLPKENNNKQKLDVKFSEHYPLHILIAEDNPVNQKLAERVLHKLGYQPSIAINGLDALSKINESHYDLILMDVQMPEMDGMEATRKIRSQENRFQPIIIAMTANAMQGDRESCIVAGMNDYISKPVKLEELVFLLEKWARQLVKSA